MSHHLLQTRWWGNLKSEFGWSLTEVSLEDEHPAPLAPTSPPGPPVPPSPPAPPSFLVPPSPPVPPTPLLVFLRNVGPFRIAYIPYGFYRTVLPLSRVTAVLRRIGQDAGVHLVRWDVPWDVESFDTARAEEAGLLPAPLRVQPPDTVLLDLSADEDALLSAMKPKTRYNIRLAEKRGVSLERWEPQGALDPECAAAFTRWYQLYRETARRDRIGIHREHYYRRVLETASGADAPRLFLYLARHEEDVLGGVIIASWNGASTYLYGAGGEVKRNLMASYLLQWGAIREARARGDGLYDFFGIPPTDDPAHSMHGLYRFKTGFGGRIVHRPGAWDLPVHPLVSPLFRGAETVRRWYHHDLRKRLPRRRRGE